MRTRFALSALVVLAALGSSPQTHAASKRTTVLLIPVDRNAGTAAIKFTEYLEIAVSKRANYVLKDAATVLGDSTPTQALEARKRVIGALSEGRKLYAAGSFDEAESALRTALIDIDNASAAFERCGEYCETLAYLAGAQVMKGDEQGARDVLKQLLAIEKTFRFDSAVFGKNLMVLVRDVERKLAEETLVAITVQTNPAGGKVFLDGNYKGYAPLTIDRQTPGKHLLRVERPGSITYGQLVDVGSGDEITVKAKLTSTPEFSSLEGSLDKIIDELERGEGATELYRLGTKLKVERAIVGLVRTNDNRVNLDCVFVDFPGKKKLSKKNRSFQGEEFGELGKEVQRFGNLLIAEGDSGRGNAKASSDPLDSRTGDEDWDEEGSGSNIKPASGGDEGDKPAKKKETKKKKDQDEGGTGDW
ncbi:MAG: PEGA domain-containing protein [Myxococcales bacterium]